MLLDAARVPARLTPMQRRCGHTAHHHDYNSSAASLVMLLMAWALLAVAGWLGMGGAAPAAVFVRACDDALHGAVATASAALSVTPLVVVMWRRVLLRPSRGWRD